MQERICDDMAKAISNVFKKPTTDRFQFKDAEFEAIGVQMKEKVDKIFGRSLAIRELDSGSDNSTEIELNNLFNPLLRC